MFLEVRKPATLPKSQLNVPWLRFPRFLRASKWNAANCIKKLEAALKWRREYGIYDTLTLESIKEHVRTHSQYARFETLSDSECAVSKREGVYIWVRC